MAFGWIFFLCSGNGGWYMDTCSPSSTLWELLTPVGRRVSVETLAGRKLAIDASIWIIQFMKEMRDDRGEMVRNAHLIGFFRRICKLLFLRVKPVFFFDGGTPALKRRTVIARRRQRENAQDKIRKTAEKLLLNHLRARKLEDRVRQIHNPKSDENSASDKIEGRVDTGQSLQLQDKLAQKSKQLKGRHQSTVEKKAFCFKAGAYQLFQHLRTSQFVKSQEGAADVELNDSHRDGFSKWVFHQYHEHLLQANGIDFNIFVRYTLHMLKKWPNAMESAGLKAQYIFVDEFQDTDVSQFELLKILCKDHAHITVVEHRAKAKPVSIDMIKPELCIDYQCIHQVGFNIELKKMVVMSAWIKDMSVHKFQLAQTRSTNGQRKWHKKNSHFSLRFRIEGADPHYIRASV